MTTPTNPDPQDCWDWIAPIMLKILAALGVVAVAIGAAAYLVLTNYYVVIEPLPSPASAVEQASCGSCRKGENK